MAAWQARNGVRSYKGKGAVPNQCMIDWSGEACRQSRASPTMVGVA
jgi:hypothetical protein